MRRRSLRVRSTSGIDRRLRGGSTAGGAAGRTTGSASPQTGGVMSRFSRVGVVGAFGMVLGLAAPPGVEAQSCPKDSVRSGSACVDKYEASVWLIVPAGANAQPTAGQKQVIDSIRNGNVTLSDLNRIGAVQLGIAFQDLENNG